MQEEGLAVRAGTGDAESGRGEDGRVAVVIVEGVCGAEGHYLGVGGFLLVGQVGVGCAGGFEREADILAAAGETWVVKEFIMRLGALLL